MTNYREVLRLFVALVESPWHHAQSDEGSLLLIHSTDSILPDAVGCIDLSTGISEREGTLSIRHFPHILSTLLHNRACPVSLRDGSSIY